MISCIRQLTRSVTSTWNVRPGCEQQGETAVRTGHFLSLRQRHSVSTQMRTPAMLQQYPTQKLKDSNEANLEAMELAQRTTTCSFVDTVSLRLAKMRGKMTERLAVARVYESIFVWG